MEKFYYIKVFQNISLEKNKERDRVKMILMEELKVQVINNSSI
jgi:hypothetical protein